MTNEERNTVIQRLISVGVSGAKYSDSYSQFYLCDIPASKGRREFYIKEKSLSIGFYGCEYEIMRKWVDKEIKAFVEKQFPAWKYFRRDTENPKGDRAVWFNLQLHGDADNDEQNEDWYEIRDNVLDVAVQLYKKLETYGVFSDNFDAKTFQVSPNSMLKDKIKLLLENNFNVVLTGAPGTGKTYTAREVAKEMVGAKLQDNATEDQKAEAKKAEEDRIASVQFHPGYDYSDFVIGMKPKLIGERGKEQVSFDWQEGIFKAFADKAKDDPAHNYVFLIDEINRADLSRVFGELFSLLEEEYRYFIDDKGQKQNEKGITLPNGEPFVISKNLYIIGTMNDIDRSVESMDFALRRRFAWYEVKPEDPTSTELDAIIKAKWDEGKIPGEDAKMLDKAMKALNKLIAPPTKEGDEKGTENQSGEPSLDLRLGSEYQLGGAIFAKYEKYAGQSDGFDCLWNNHIENILSEYLRGRSNRDKLLAELKTVFEKAIKNDGDNGNSKATAAADNISTVTGSTSSDSVQAR